MTNSDATNQKLALYETLNTVFWVALDIAWFFQFNLACVVAAVPTVLTCVAIFRYTDRTVGPLLVSGAVAFWACFNVFWVLGDLKMLAWGLAAAKMFILLLVVSLLGALIAAAMSSKAKVAVLARLRRLRVSHRWKEDALSRDRVAVVIKKSPARL
jgi:hypothetical protein